MKEKRTELEVTILTDYEHETGDVLERVRQKVEMTTFHLQSLFHFLRRSAIDFDKSFVESRTVEDFCNDLINFADLGEGFALSICAAISDLTDLQMKSESETLAEKISFLLNDDNVPSEISEAISDALTEMQNASRQTEVLKLEKSSEYIARILRDHRQSNGGER